MTFQKTNALLASLFSLRRAGGIARRGKCKSLGRSGKLYDLRSNLTSHSNCVVEPELMGGVTGKTWRRQGSARVL